MIDQAIKVLPIHPFSLLNVVQILLLLVFTDSPSTPYIPIFFSAGQFIYWWVAEKFFRVDKVYKKETDRKDRLNIIGLFWMTYVPVFAAIFERNLPLNTAFPLGVVSTSILVFLFLCGHFLRFWAMATLGSSFTAGLRVSENQKVIQTGPYAFIRHPGYSANGLVFLPAGFGIHPSLLCLLCVVGGYIVFWGNRITVEEDMLTKELKEYSEYKKKVPSRLIPYVF